MLLDRKCTSIIEFGEELKFCGKKLLNLEDEDGVTRFCPKCDSVELLPIEIQEQLGIL